MFSVCKVYSSFIDPKWKEERIKTKRWKTSSRKKKIIFVGGKYQFIFGFAWHTSSSVVRLLRSGKIEHQEQFKMILSTDNSLK